MALPSSGPLTLAQIQSEFGGTNPIGLNEYYAGGANVPAGTTGTYGAVPSSGAISIRNFYGTSDVVISITDQYIQDISGGFRSATAGYRLTSAGLAQVLVNITYTTVETWCTPTSEAGNYEVLATLVSGNTPSGTLGSWVALSTSQEWALSRNVPQNASCIFTVQIRRTGTVTVLATATIELEADATP
jgi:hypothetical protein